MESMTQRRIVKTRVFGIGLPKTATSSLASALSVLCYKPLHDDYVARTAIEYEAKNGLKLLSSLNEYNAFADIPFDNIFRELDKAYPGSKFVLTTRCRDSWLLSRRKHVMGNRRTLRYRGEELRINVPGWKKRWTEHHSAVLEYFAGRPNDLLVLRICDGEGWGKLCPFLGEPNPDTPFPRSNRSVDRQFPSAFQASLARALQFTRRIYHRLSGRHDYNSEGWGTSRPIRVD